MDSNKIFRNHKKIQKKLIDVYYGEKELSDELKAHINTCSECAKHWNELKMLSTKLDILESKVEIDGSVIERAFEEAEKLKRRKKIKEFFAFLCIAAILLALESWIALSGYEVQIIFIQFILMLVILISVPFMLSKRIKKEVESK